MEATKESAAMEVPSAVMKVPSFAIRENGNINFLRSISLQHDNSPSFTPPRLSAPNPLSESFLTDSSYIKYISAVLKRDGQILCIAVSNTMAYTGSSSNVIRIWKLPEITECGQLKSKAKMVVAIQVSNDRVFAAYSDCKIRVWSRCTYDGVTKHARLATIPKSEGYVRSFITDKDKTIKHMGPISSLAINLSEDLIYSASLDRTVKVWRISDLKCIETIQAHSAPINAMVLGEDEGLLYTGSDDATVKVWRHNFPSGNRPHTHVLTLSAKHSPVRTLTLNPDGKVLYGGCSDGYIHCWIKSSGRLQYGGPLRGHTHAVMCLTSVANFVVSGSADSTGRVWFRDIDGNHSCVVVLQGHRGPIRCLAAFPGRVLDAGADQSVNICTGSMDGLLKVWRVRRSNRASKSIGSGNFELN